MRPYRGTLGKGSRMAPPRGGAGVGTRPPPSCDGEASTWHRDAALGLSGLEQGPGAVGGHRCLLQFFKTTVITNLPPLPGVAFLLNAM